MRLCVRVCVSMCFSFFNCFLSMISYCNNKSCNAGKTYWASKIIDVLHKYGFGWVWISQYVPDEAVFYKDYCNRVRDCELQMWTEEKQLMPKLVTYDLFKHSRDCEPYLKINIPGRLLISFARFRTGSHNLEIAVGRHHKLAREDRSF